MPLTAFAILLDHPIHNFMRHLAVEMDTRFGTGLLAAVHPSHVTLKQSFPLHDLPSMVAYFDRLAASIQPLPIHLTHLEFVTRSTEDGERGTLWLAVNETPILRALHERINRELAAQFRDTAAPFDGPGFRFHATIAAGAEPERFRCAYSAYRDTPVDLRCTARHIAMAYAPDDDLIIYKILPLGKRSS